VAFLASKEAGEVVHTLVDLILRHLLFLLLSIATSPPIAHFF